MSRTKGSGWGGGVILWQRCPACLKKKVVYKWVHYIGYHFWCTSCKKQIEDPNLVKQQFITL